MTPEILLKTAIIPALSLIDPSLDTPAARAMLICIALQESGLRARRQMLEARDHWWESKPGPANGLWQFERDGGVRGVMRHAAASAIVLPVIDALLYPRDPYAVHEALIHNDVLACVLARALLYSTPDAMPRPGESEKGWAIYLKAWRPGKAHVDPWANNYRTAWAAV
ncbi:MAG: hypothetical protein AB7V39_25505 [Nitrospiraceae bacterium]